MPPPTHLRQAAQSIDSRKRTYKDVQDISTILAAHGDWIVMDCIYGVSCNPTGQHGGTKWKRQRPEVCSAEST